ncbi:MAG TPA: SRPBCC family protein [Candidatus Limnocylindria bacterium]|nr:SRPBCC family protein [Candidatus Limnocylindria bacterium]
MRVEASLVIERPKATVFRFVAREHVRNHPRWDPDIQLRADSESPIGVGTIIRRRNSRSGRPVEGTMEVVEFEPDDSFGTVIREGTAQVLGRSTFEAVSPGRTRLTISADLPSMPAGEEPLGADSTRLAKLMERSVARIKELIEAET